MSLVSIRRASATVVAAGLVLSSASAAFAQEAPAPQAAAPEKPAFGDAGQIALSINQGLVSTAAGQVTGTGIGASYFVIPHLSLGLELGVGWVQNMYPESGTPTSNSTDDFFLRAGPRLGYDIPLSDKVSLWPQVGVDYRHFDAGDSSGGPGSSYNTLGFVAVAPLVIHPLPGFFVGAGPSFNADFFSKANAGSSSYDTPKQVSVGLMATIGGAF
ncbi:MAG TPA: outer membrane beta-barrel protein [Polyangiaceae bacterium]|jgi:hypothetical protein